MKIKIIDKKNDKTKQEMPIMTRNGKTFNKHPRKENCWIYHGRNANFKLLDIHI
jgi:hypothetical protein